MKNVNPTVAAELSKYILDTDIVNEVESRTSNHYCLNNEFEVIRGGKKFFIRVKEVNVICQNKKSHVRIEVDTDLKPKQTKTVDLEKIKNDLDKVNAWLEINEKHFKGSDYLYKQKNKRDRLISKLELHK